MKKMLLSLTFLFSFGAYALMHQGTDIVVTRQVAAAGNTDSATSDIKNPNPPTSPPSTTTIAKPARKSVTKRVTNGIATVATPIQEPASEAPVLPAGQYVDGTYSGSRADSYYGVVQVQAIIQNGKLTDVKFLSYPNDRRTSEEINSQALPYLKQEALQAQSAQVDAVSGASDTSTAFQESLGVALQQAKA